MLSVHCLYPVLFFALSGAKEGKTNSQNHQPNSPSIVIFEKTYKMDNNNKVSTACLLICVAKRLINYLTVFGNW